MFLAALILLLTKSIKAFNKQFVWQALTQLDFVMRWDEYVDKKNHFYTAEVIRHITSLGLSAFSVTAV